jgi:hypothetical protein
MSARSDKTQRKIVKPKPKLMLMECRCVRRTIMQRIDRTDPENAQLHG